MNFDYANNTSFCMSNTHIPIPINNFCSANSFSCVGLVNAYMEEINCLRDKRKCLCEKIQQLQNLRDQIKNKACDTCKDNDMLNQEFEELRCENKCLKCKIKELEEEASCLKTLADNIRQKFANAGGFSCT
ncbi:hypothetical protein HELRODRAFT_181884 [Helobdella robusta]|uniref:Uncharacterized protein n=1 Tax=Helobdella robusta TaxID=6412 RepID=T1FHF3_HELRO|nr:hypothetical protein HELRODRAFT_181884 [Helobdella robusta]ESN91960.1 hypothetical protein HELRODRAFT_181884 [Helobdella robusta]